MVQAAITAAQIQPVAASVASSALTLTLNPTVLGFRSTPVTSGTVNNRIVSTALSVVVSNGSTLGTVNATSARLVIIAVDATSIGGAVELAVVNQTGSVNLDETTLISTTAEGGAGLADSASVIYSTTARSNVPFRVVGFIDITEATAGVWATAPTTVQGAGGQALSAKPLSLTYTSPSPSALSTSLIVAENHGLGAIPTNVDVVLRCSTTDAGYSVGDEVHISMYDAPGVSNLVVWSSATQVGVNISGNTRVANKTTNANTTLTAASWVVVIRAWK
jgi:hypothetical protein